MTSSLGTSGEALAADHLRGLGYRILAADLRTPLGQLDLVAQDGETLVFVEVKARAGLGFGLPQEAVGYQKMRKLRQVRASLRWTAGSRRVSMGTRSRLRTSVGAGRRSSAGPRISPTCGLTTNPLTADRTSSSSPTGSTRPGFRPISS